MGVEDRHLTELGAVAESPIAVRWSSALEEFFRGKSEALAPFLALYDRAIHFEDPVHSVHGIEAFAEMNRRFADRARALHIEVTDVAEGGDAFFAAWTMTFAPRIGPQMTVAGATFARVRGDKLIYQRDHFDPIGGFARAVPGLSFIYGFLIRKMA